MSVTIFGQTQAYGLGGEFSQMYVTFEGACHNIWTSSDVWSYGLGGVFSQMYVTSEGECNYI